MLYKAFLLLISCNCRIHITKKYVLLMLQKYKRDEVVAETFLNPSPNSQREGNITHAHTAKYKLDKTQTPVNFVLSIPAVAQNQLFL